MDSSDRKPYVSLVGPPSDIVYRMQDSWGMYVVGYDDEWLEQFDDGQEFIIYPIRRIENG